MPDADHTSQFAEFFLPVSGTGGRYLVSDQGRVRGPSGRILRAGATRGGYLRVVICDGRGGRRTASVHRLVLSAFRGSPPFDLVARHRNGIRTDNRLSNLEWGTHSQNYADSVRHGTAVRLMGERNGRSKLTDAQREEIRRLYSAGGVTQEALGRRFGVSSSAVFAVVRS